MGQDSTLGLGTGTIATSSREPSRSSATSSLVYDLYGLTEAEWQIVAAEVGR